MPRVFHSCLFKYTDSPDFGDYYGMHNSSNGTSNIQDNDMDDENSRDKGSGMNNDPKNSTNSVPKPDNTMDNDIENDPKNSTNSVPTAAPTNTTSTTLNLIWITVAVIIAVIMIITIVLLACCLIYKCKKKPPTKEEHCYDYIDTNQISSSQSQGRASAVAVNNTIQAHDDPKYTELSYISATGSTTMSEDTTATSTSPVVIWVSGYSGESTIYNYSYGMSMFDNQAYRALDGGRVTSSTNMSRHGDDIN